MIGLVRSAPSRRQHIRFSLMDAVSLACAEKVRSRAGVLWLDAVSSLTTASQAFGKIAPSDTGQAPFVGQQCLSL